MGGRAMGGAAAIDGALRNIDRGIKILERRSRLVDAANSALIDV
jgi:hypothetical protein